MIATAQENAATEQAPNPEIHASIEQSLSKLRVQDKKIREEAIKHLHESLMKAANTRNVYPQGETRKRLSQVLTQLYTQTKDNDFSDPSLRLGLIYDLARYGDNEVAKPFILRVLERGTKDERAEAFRGLGSPGGISGDDLYAKIEDLARRAIITDQAKTTYLARIDNERALTSILKEVRSTRDKRKFLYSAWTLQNTYRNPKNYKDILPRLKELGLTQRESFDGKSDGLFWVNAELLAAYIDIAQGSDLRLALEMMAEHAALTRPASAPALMRRLEHADPAIRALAAQALEKVLSRSLSDKKSIYQALDSAAEREVDPNTKNLIQDVISRAARADQEWQQFLKQSGRDGRR